MCSRINLEESLMEFDQSANDGGVDGLAVGASYWRQCFFRSFFEKVLIKKPLSFSLAI